MATKSNLSGPEKAAILLMSIGEDNAGNVMANMEEREIQAIGNYMSALGDVDQETMDQVTKDFYMATRTGIGGIGIAGADFLKAALMKAMDPAKATEILNNISTPGEDLSGGLETLRMLEPKNIAAFSSFFILVNSTSGLIGQFMKNDNLQQVDQFFEYSWLFIMVLVGGQIGSHFSIKVFRPEIVRRLTAVLVLYVGVRLVLLAINT